MKGFKGFTKALTCKNHQFEIGKTYEHAGEAKLCSSGFHFCEHPLDCFGYYSPHDSRFAEIEADGVADQTEADTKRVCKKITIVTELSFSAIAQAAVEFVFKMAKMETVVERAKEAKGAHSEESDGAASATGTRGAASATGTRGAASATGTRGAASATGTRGAASATGDQGAASATGDQGAASATGEEGCAVALGIEGKVKGEKGTWLTAAEWKYSDKESIYHRINVKTARVDGKKIKADTWYQLRGGKFVPA